MEQLDGLYWTKPYFILHAITRGEYFFGELGWPVSYRMEFVNENGLIFKIGPMALKAALRVIAPDETITTPTVHLAYIKGNFDTAVQTMQDHIRRSVVPTCNPERSYRVQYLFPSDQPLSVYQGMSYNSANVEKCMDVAAAAGMEAFIVDGPTWCATYGEWLEPDPKRFPNGFGPLRRYAHNRGLLFGVYFELEGGRNLLRMAFALI